MEQQARIRLRSLNAYSMLEMAAAAAVIAAVLSAVLPVCSSRADRANFDKTVAEMGTIAQASVDYYNTEHRWPGRVSDLAPAYIFQVPLSNAWGKDGYHLAGGDGLIVVSTTIPAGTAPVSSNGPLFNVAPFVEGDQLYLSRRIPLSVTAGLLYEKKTG